MEHEQLSLQWIQQAIDAIDRGADPLAVNRRLKQMAVSAGIKDIMPVVPTGTSEDDELVQKVRSVWEPQRGITRDTARDYIQATTPSVVKELNTLQHSPHQSWVEHGILDYSPESISEYYDEQERKGLYDGAPDVRDSRSLEAALKGRRLAQSNEAQLFKEGVKVGVAGPVQGLLRAIPSDWTQGAADALKSGIERNMYDPGLDAYEDSLRGQLRQGVALTGNLAGTLAGMAIPGSSVTKLGIIGAGLGSQSAERALDAGASDTEAFLYGTGHGVSMPLLGVLPPAVGSGLLTRAATGAGLNLGAGVGLDAYMNTFAPEELQQDLLDPWARGADLVLGATVGGASRPTAPARPRNIREPQHTPVEPFDPNPTQVDIFGDSVPPRVAPEAEVPVSRPAAEPPSPDTRSLTDPVQPELGSDAGTYGTVLDRQGAPVPEQPPSKNVTEAAPKLSEEQQRQVGQLDAAIDAANQAGDKDLAKRLSIYRDAIAGEAGAKPSPSYKNVTESYDFLKWFYGSEVVDSDGSPLVVYHGRSGSFGGESFDPDSASGMHFGTSEQASLVASSAEEGNVVPVYLSIRRIKRMDDQHTDAGWQRAIEEAKRQGYDGIVYANEVEGAGDSYVAFYPDQIRSATMGDSALFSTPKPGTFSPSLVNKLRNGELVASDVFDFFRNEVSQQGDAGRQAANLASYFEALAEKIGGKGTRIRELDLDNPDHQAIIDKHENLKNMKFAGFFLPEDNTIYVLPSHSTGRVLLHEVGHGITHMMLHAARNNKLSEAGQKAFSRLDYGFSVIRDELLDRSGGNLNLTYGLTNLDEFYSEFLSNGVFRQSLKNLKLEGDWTKRLPEQQRTWLGKTKTLYDWAVRGLSDVMVKAGLSRKSLGLKEEIGSAYEFMFRSMDDLHGSITPKEARTLRDINSRNTIPRSSDLGFLGEMAEPRRQPLLMHNIEENGAPVFSQPKLTRPIGPVSTRLRNLLLTKGSRPLLHERDAGMQRNGYGTDVMTSAVRNLYVSESKKLAGAEPIITLALTDANVRPDAMRFISERSPAVADMLEREIAAKATNALKLAEEMRSVPNAPESWLKIADTIEANKDTYLYQGYQAKDPSMKSEYVANFKKALKSGDEEIVHRYETAKRYIKDRWLPSAAELADKSTSELKAIFTMHTGREVPTSMQKVDLLLEIDKALAKIKNPEQWADNATMAALEGDKGSPVGRYYNRFGLGTDVGKTLTNVPDPIADLWGRVDHPVLKLMLSRANQEKQIANLATMRQLREDGIAEGYFTDRPDTSTHTARIDDPDMPHLRGMYTTPDIHALLTTPKDANNLAKRLYRVATVLPRVNKFTTIVGNLLNPLRDGIGATGMMLNNGVINPDYMAKGAKAAWYAVGTGLRKQPPSADAEWLIRNGFMQYAVAPELQRRARGVGMEDFRKIGELMENPEFLQSPVEWFANNASKLGKGAKELMDIYTDLYSLTELVPKAAAAIQERDFWRRKRPNWSDERIDKLVRKRIDNTTLTPSNVPPLLKGMDDLGATFVVRYISSMYKNSLYAMAYGLQDLKEGIRTGDADIAAYGARRLIGSATATTIAPIILNEMFGADGAAQEYLDDSDITSNVTYHITRDEDGKEYKTDIDRLNAYGPFTQPVYRLSKAVFAASEGNKEEANKQLTIAGKDIVSALGANSVWGKLNRAINGSPSSLEKRVPEAFDRLKDTVLDRLPISMETFNSLANASEIVLPKTVENIVAGAFLDGTTRAKIAVGSGLSTPFDPGGDLHRYGGLAFNRDITEARKPYMDSLRSGMSLKPDRIEREFVRGLKASIKPYESLKITVNAMREQGRTEDEVLQALEGSRINKNAISMLYNNDERVAQLMVGDVEASLRNDIKAQSDRIRRKKLIDQLPEKLQLTHMLLDKYISYTIDDIKAGALDNGR